MCVTANPALLCTPRSPILSKDEKKDTYKKYSYTRQRHLIPKRILVQQVVTEVQNLQSVLLLKDGVVGNLHEALVGKRESLEAQHHSRAAGGLHVTALTLFTSVGSPPPRHQDT